jgi:glycosyltransferase involved in cell wall biosynthesis
VSRVLLVCPEPLGHQNPAGVGIRFLEFARVLRGAGHEVAVLSLDGGAVEGCITETTNPEALNKFSAGAEVVVVQGHVVNDVLAHGVERPLVVDLYDPFIIDNFHYAVERGAEVYEHDYATLARSLEAGDFFLCASEAQRIFYLGALLAAGRYDGVMFDRDPSLRSLIDIVPFGVEPPRERKHPSNAPPRLLFGGIYDWYDPLVAMEAVAIARESVPALTLTFTRHPNPELTPQGAAARAIDHAASRGYDFVHFEPWVSYARRGEFYDRFAAALVTFPQSLETDLSMRTRVFDYLWGGLPVIASSAPGTDAVLQRYGAGRIMRSSAPAEVAAEIVHFLTHEETYRRCSEGAAAFVRDHQWSSLLEPLVTFCSNPSKAPAAGAGQTMLRPRRSLIERLRHRIGGAS